LGDGEVLLLENLRFHKEEVLGQSSFARQLADLANVYCNEAFSASHRAHASLAGVPRIMVESDGAHARPRVAGLALQRELRFLGETLRNPRRPFVAILGGTGVAEKIDAVLHMLDRLDFILIGGALTYTFMAAEHKEVGESLVDHTAVKEAARVLHAAASSGARLILPAGHICGQAPYPATPNRITEEVIPEGWMGLDIGPRAVVQFVEIIRHARTIFWSGPMGALETRPFDVSTKEIALAVTHATQISGATSIVGGSDTTRLLQRMGLERSVSHITTGGAATLAMLAGQRFEAVDLLDDRGAEPAVARGAEETLAR
jgi:phosphoglycerate kinase